MNKRVLKRGAIHLLLLSTIAVVFGAWTKVTHQSFADTLMGVGLVGNLSGILLLVAVFGAKNRTSD